AAAQAERIATHAADRVVYTPALNRDWVGTANVLDLGRAWGAAAGWADVDPVAHVAATRVEQRLAEMAPNAMARFAELRGTGMDRIEAMRDVLPRVATEIAYQPTAFVAPGRPGPTQTADERDASAAAQYAANAAAEQARRSEATPDNPAT